MLIVRGIETGTCICCGREAVECLVIECQQQTFAGLLCLKDFVAQVKMRTRCPAPSATTPIDGSGNSVPQE